MLVCIMLVYMRTTLQLDDELVVQAKIRAARSGRTLSQVIEDALRQAHADHVEPTRRRVLVPTSPGCPLPGVNLHDNADLLDLMADSR
jgi:plasmid stability protein